MSDPAHPTSRRWLRPLVWLLVLGTALALAAQLRPHAKMSAALPDTAAGAKRDVAFFEDLPIAQSMVLEASFAAGCADDGRAALLEVSRALAVHGATPRPAASAAQLASLLDRVATHLPALLCDEDWAEISRRTQSETVQARLRHLLSLLAQPGGEQRPEVAAVYDDPLGLRFVVLDKLRQALGDQQMAGADGVVMHADGQHALISLLVDFPPSNGQRSAALVGAAETAALPWMAKGITVRVVGSYRHFRDNYTQIWNDLYLSMPTSLLAIAIILYALVRSWRALLVLHVAPLTALLGGAAGLCLWMGPQVHVLVLGFAPALLGIAEEYSIHMVRAAQHGGSHVRAVRAPLLVSFATTATAFMVLAFSTVPNVAGFGIMVVAGLGLTLAVTLDLMPRWVRPIGAQALPWQGASRVLAHTIERRPWANLLLWGIASAALLPGLGRLHFESDMQNLDGSRPEAWQALHAVQERWGALGGSAFLVGSGRDPAAASDQLCAARRSLGLAAGAVERLLPGPAETARRLSAWNSFWTLHSESTQQHLAAACAALGLSADALKPSAATYQSWSRERLGTLTLDTWAGSPLHAVLGRLQFASGTQVQLASPVALRSLAEEAPVLRGLEALGEQSTVWLASKRQMGVKIESTGRTELLRLGGWVLLVMVLTVIALERSPRRIAAVVLGTLSGLGWCFGILGWCGVALTPFHVLVAAFVGGIGVDFAIFMSRADVRRQALAPAGAMTLTTVLGTGSMATGGHPVVAGIGLALCLGMACCLAASLLVCPALGGGQSGDDDHTPPP